MKKPAFPTVFLFVMLLAGSMPMANAAPYTKLDIAIPPGRNLPLLVGEKMGYPPMTPDDAKLEPVNEEAVQKDVDAQLKAKFEAAARHSNQMLTAQGAIDAGWGFIADHFAEIDKNRDGSATFGEVSAFMQARSSGNQMKNPVQIVE
jgi:hypothetical protein